MTQYWKSWEGQKIDSTYPLLQCLAGNDQHAVFLTETGDTPPRKAAIKIVLGSVESTQSQFDQWRLASGVSHPHLLRTLAMADSELEGTSFIYLVTEYADENLAQVIAERPLGPDETKETLYPILSALSYLHGQGLVHGHLTAANVMAIDGSLKLSSDTVRRADESSAAEDVRTLGLTLVEMMTQRSDADAAETLPQPFLDIARNSLEPDPSRRWTVKQIKARLRPGAVIPTAPAPASAPAPAPRSTATPVSKKARYRLAAVGGLALAILIVALIAFSRPSAVPDTQSPADPTQPPAAQQPAVQQPIAKQPVQQPAAQQPVPKPEPTADRNKPQPAPEPPSQGTSRVEVVSRAMPDVPRQASHTIHGTVKVAVRIYVDPSGIVSRAQVESQGPSRYFADHALAAARRWRFTPGDAATEWILRFEFTSTDETANIVRAAR